MTFPCRDLSLRVIVHYQILVAQISYQAVMTLIVARQEVYQMKWIRMTLTKMVSVTGMHVWILNNVFFFRCLL